MTAQVFTFDQRSVEWEHARLGIPTASMFHCVLAKGEGKTRRSYLMKLAGERLTGEPMENYTNAHMERGVVMEDEARDLYAFVNDAPLLRVGFIRNGDTGCSPDALVGDDGVLEIKSALPHVLIDHLTRGSFPSEHVAQCQGALWIAERDWIDLAIYAPRLPLFVKRATRDDKYIAELATAVIAFNDELAKTVERVRHYGSPSTLKTDLQQSIIAAG